MNDLKADAEVERILWEVTKGELGEYIPRTEIEPLLTLKHTNTCTKLHTFTHINTCESIHICTCSQTSVHKYKCRQSPGRPRPLPPSGGLAGTRGGFGRRRGSSTGPSQLIRNRAVDDSFVLDFYIFQSIIFGRLVQVDLCV